MNYFQKAVQTGVKAAKANVLPACVLQAAGISLILLYFNHAGTREFLNEIGRLNRANSPYFAIFVTMIFGGAIPLCVDAIKRRKKGMPSYSVLQIVFTLVIWGFNGALVEWLYSTQSKIFGDDLTFFTVLKKVLVDQLIWVPLFPIPFFAMMYLWRDQHFSLSGVQSALARKPFLSRIIPMVIANWAVWVPAVSVIYSFPPDLQLPLMNLVLVIWSLILTFFTKEE